VFAFLCLSGGGPAGEVPYLWEGPGGAKNEQKVAVLLSPLARRTTNFTPVRAEDVPEFKSKK
jgi:hypothetical protein